MSASIPIVFKKLWFQPTIVGIPLWPLFACCHRGPIDDVCSGTGLSAQGQGSLWVRLGRCGTREKYLPKYRASTAFLIYKSRQNLTEPRSTALTPHCLHPTMVLTRLAYSFGFLSSVFAQKVINLSGNHWTLTDQQGNVSIPGSVPSNAYLDLFAAKLIPDPLYGN